MRYASGAMNPTEHEQLLAFLEGRFTEVNRQFSEVARQFTAMDERFDRLHGEVANLRHEMLGHFDGIYRRLERLEQENVAIGQGLRRIEARLADDTGRREVLVRDLTALKEQVAVLQARIADLEERLGR